MAKKPESAKKAPAAKTTSAAGKSPKRIAQTSAPAAPQTGAGTAAAKNTSPSAAPAQQSPKPAAAASPAIPAKAAEPRIVPPAVTAAQTQQKQQPSQAKQPSAETASTAQTTTSAAKKTPAVKKAVKATNGGGASAASVSISTDDIALRAYFISERRHAQGLPGDEAGDWLEAERQLKAERAGK